MLRRFDIERKASRRDVARRRVDALANALAGAADRNRPLLVAAFSATFLIATSFLADRKVLWNDELFTYYFARLPTLSDLWSELATGIDQTPPFFYLITRTFLGVFGMTDLALRLPEVLGFIAMCVCTFFFVARRSSALYGLVAMLVPPASTAYYYAYEARPYGLALGFSAAALLCWQRACEGGPGRTRAAVALAVTLALAISSHYYAVLLLVPLIAGEISRAFASRRIDWRVLASLTVALLPVLFFLPLIEGARKYSATFWARPRWDDVEGFYGFLLAPQSVWVGIQLVLLLAALTVIVDRWKRRGEELRRGSIPAHELVAVGTLSLLPLSGVTTAKLLTGAYTHRYALAAVIGVSILIAFAANVVDRKTPLVGLSLLCILCFSFVLRFIDDYGNTKIAAEQQIQRLRFLEEQSRGRSPIVISSPHEFFVVSHYASRDRRGRFIYLADQRQPFATSAQTSWISACLA